MKLFRFGIKGNEKPGIEFSDGLRYDLSEEIKDYNEDFFRENELLSFCQRIEAKRSDLPILSTVLRFGSAVARPSKIVCIGLNYREHADETGAKHPDEPVLFMKATSALSGPNDNVIIPRGSQKLDYEVELAVIIGKECRYVSEEQALEHVAGYALANDFSERAFQKERGGQWMKGKSADSFAPIGPYLVPAAQIDNPQNLQLKLSVNGELRQNSSTANMIFPVKYLISYISQFMTLLPGDVINTGTPSGVGMGMSPQRFLRAGDVVEYSIDKLGEAKQTVIAELASSK
jgi:2,4-diketo-3-deoxy-L-fuconate hydrolase